MATKDEVDCLIRNTESLTWIVAGLPVVACFPGETDAEARKFLGTVTDRNDYDENLQLWVALDQDTRQVLVLLTIRIKASMNRKPNRRVFFLVVPAEGLLLQSSVVNYDALDLPQEHFEVPSDARSMKHKMLQLCFQSMLKPSYVVMQSYPNPSKLALQSEVLLCKLKRLSEASDFVLYADHVQDTQQSLNVTCAMLHSENKPITPRICLQGLYPGGRSGCIDSWHTQGLRKTPVATTHKSFDQALGPFVRNSSAPPSYSKAGPNENSRAASFAASVDSQHLPCLPATPTRIPRQNPSRLHSDPASSPHVRTSTRPRSSLHDSGTSRVFSLRNSPVPCMPESTLSSGYTATFLSSASRHVHSPVAQVAVSPLDVDALSHALFNGPACPADRIPDSSRKRRPSPSLDLGHGSVKRAANVAQVEASRAAWSPCLPSTRVASGATPSPTNFCPSLHLAAESGHSRTSTASPGTLYKLRWLRKAWDFCPSAHYIFIAELIRLGRATGSNDIATSGVDCTLALMRWMLREYLTKQGFDMTHVAERDVGEHTSTLVRWLYTLEPGADVDFCEDLVQLALLENRSVDSFDEAVEYDHLRALFLCRKAEIVTEACTRFGKDLSQQDEMDLVARMLRESDCIASN